MKVTMDVQTLKERQTWTLNQKIDHSLGVIDQFISRLDGKVYVGFSGGKDSTVLLDLCRLINPDIKAVFCNTGNEYPDIVKFVRELKNRGYNIEIIHPKLRPQDVMATYGFPLISKEVSEKIWYAKYKPESQRGKLGLGFVESAFYKIPQKYKFLINEKFDVHSKCCMMLKKKPFHEYEKENKVSPILGVMASESLMRQTAYIKRGGCNVFNEKGRMMSLPLSIWLEKDIWNYIDKRKIKIADIYYKGAKRTGCMFCGYGCQFKDDNRLRLVYNLYPKWYERFMSYTSNGVTYREALRKTLSVNGLYLPDEEPKTLFKDSDFE